jgi:drug/metabolite transporter (DMT)-like permease
MNLHIFFMNAGLAKFQNSSVIVFSTDINFGCLGFLNLADNNLLVLGMYALFASFFGSAGYVLCLLFYSPLVTSNAYLLEPFFAQMLGFILGLDKLPGLMTLLGTIFAVFGIMHIDKGSRLRAEEAKYKEAIKQNAAINDSESLEPSD